VRSVRVTSQNEKLVVNPLTDLIPQRGELYENRLDYGIGRSSSIKARRHCDRLPTGLIHA
jgi:hypothetical protein